LHACCVKYAVAKCLEYDDGFRLRDPYFLFAIDSDRGSISLVFEIWAWDRQTDGKDY